MSAAVSSRTSFNHTVGAQQNGLRNGDAQRLGGLQVDHQLVVGGLLDRNVARLRAFENAGGHVGGPSHGFRLVGVIGDENPASSQIAAQAARRGRPARLYKR